MQASTVRTAHKSRRAWLPALAGAVLAAAAAAAPAQVSLTTVVELAQKNSVTVRLAQADVQKATAELAQSRDAFIPSVSFGSGLPAFREVGFTGSLPTIWDSSVQSLVFSMPQIQYIHAARAGVQAAQFGIAGCARTGGPRCFDGLYRAGHGESRTGSGAPAGAGCGAAGGDRTAARGGGRRSVEHALAGATDGGATQAEPAASGNSRRNALQAIGSTHGFAGGLDYSRSREHSRDSGGDWRSHAGADAGC